MRYFILVLLWFSFCILHSGIITLTVTNFLKLKLGTYYKFFRLFYNIFSLAVLIPVVLYSNSIKTSPFFIWDGFLLPIRYILIALGIGLFVLGARRYSMSNFLGLAQIKEHVGHNLINKTGMLDSGGILGVIRHPFYTGTILLIWTGNLDYTALVTNIILSIYVIIGTWLEEQKLLVEFGTAYRQYQQKVSMLFPVKWIKFKIKEIVSKMV